ncbi:putative germ cell-specific protein 1-like protein 2 [Platysternon megacephalum]|uniref:Putative germ cell-specific protein 1-like protein 2 n=1 Tax=Platysternon megacephalum TaxID=55544 RepID=A0A4D9E1N2_9SAUR|nr:putative germ cell-specific protein 1-like protein 2 [Platysternon megacephalum]
MAHARISAKLPPDIDPTKAPIAFGERALPKLNEELQSPELLTRQRALMALCDLVHDPENVYQAIKLGFLDNLKYLLLDHDSTVREKTTEVLYIMATHNVGRQVYSPEFTGWYWGVEMVAQVSVKNIQQQFPSFIKIAGVC